MPKDHRFPQPNRAEAAVVVVMQVRSADPARRQPQPHLSRPLGFLGPVLDPQVTRGMNDNRPHHSTGVSSG